MMFHLKLEYKSTERENALDLLHTGGLDTECGVAIETSWVAVETCTAFALVETTNAKGMYDLCSRWSDVGTVTVTPVLSSAKI